MAYEITQTDSGFRITDSTGSEANILTQAAQPASGSVRMSVERFGSFLRVNFRLNAARISVTDAAGSGSFGALKLADFSQTAFTILGSRQDYTAFAEGSALTGGAGDAVFVIAVGTAAVGAAADGALSGTSVNIGGTVSVTLSGGTGTGTTVTGASSTAINGTASASSINLNWSGTAATIDATSTIDVTGTISCVFAITGDD